MTVSIKRYSDSLREFEQHVSGHFDHRLSLIGTKSKDRPLSWRDNSPSRTKGVESDLIVIFEDRSKVVKKEKLGRFKERPVYDSFAFSFNRESDDSDALIVSYSTRIDGEIASSTPFSESVFRDLIREINRNFRNDGVPKDRQTLLWRLSAVFMENPGHGIRPFDSDEALDAILGKDRDEALRLKGVIEEADKDALETKAELSRIQCQIEQEANQSAEAIEIQRLEKEIEKLKKKIGRKKSEAFKARGGKDLAQKENHDIEKGNEARRTLFKVIESIQQRAPSDPASKSSVQKWLDQNT